VTKLEDGERRCGGCGEVMPHGRHGSWCSSWCESRAAQGLPPQPPPGLRPPTVVVPIGSGGPPTGPGTGGVRVSVGERVRATLESAGLAETWEASAALDLAASIDEGGLSGSARAAVHGALRSAMRDLLRGVDGAGSKVGGYRDELAARRERRAGGA
jgi:hypothetical protein